MTLVQKMMQLELNELQQALTLFPNNKTKAAAHLGIRRTTLLQKLKKYGFPLKPPNRKKETK